MPEHSPGCASNKIVTMPRARPSLKILLLALADALGMALVATGAFWLWKGQHLIVRAFPSTSIEAGLCLAGGLLLMIWSVAGILREILARAAERHTTEEPDSNNNGAKY